MKISVVIATYNDPQLDNCLESLFKSDDVDFEVIVVDDGSTKIDSKLIADKYPQCRFFSFEKNQGPAAARNFGVSKTEGDLVFFIDSDAEVYPDTLKKIVNRFEPDSDLAGLTITWSDSPIKDNFFNKFKAIETNYLAKKVWRRSFGSNGSAIYRKIYLAEGGFDPNFKTAHAEDFYFGLKLFSKGYKIALDNDILMKNSYLDRFFFAGFKKYVKRSFLRAMVICQVKKSPETSYNSRKFKELYLLSLSILFFVVSSIFFGFFILVALFLYLIFFYLNRELYAKFYQKYGFIFWIKSIALHYFYILTVAVSGIAGLIYAFLFKRKNSL